MVPISRFSKELRRIIPVLLLLSVAVSVQGRLIVSELYRDPPGTESDSTEGGASLEFIELTNLGPDSFFIDGLYITNGAEADSVVPETDILPGHENCRYDSRTIAPGITALILDPDYRTTVVADSTLRLVIPDSTPLLHCGDGEFGSNATGLAATHGITVYRGSKTRIDSVICSAADAEMTLSSPTNNKVVLAEPSNIEGVSVVAVAILSDNPHYDYCPESISPGRFEPLRGGWIAELHIGRLDSSRASIPCTTEVLSTREFSGGTVAWRITRTYRSSTTVFRSGSITLSVLRGSATFSLPADSASFSFSLQTDDQPVWPIDLSVAWLPEAAITITEIAPKATADEPEWFEIKNNSSLTINLKNWRYGKNDDTVTITSTAFNLRPGAYTVITRNAGMLATRYRALPPSITPRHWITLDNGSDTITLFDAAGTVREVVCYDDSWFSEWPYTSIERSGDDDGCSPTVWSVASRPTPGLPNEAQQWRNTDKPVLDIGPIPFTPDGDGKDDRLSIRMRLPPSCDASVTIYGFDGRAVMTFTGQPREVRFWDGRNASGNAAPPGPFFVVAEIEGKGAPVYLRKKGILWRRK